MKDIKEVSKVFDKRPLKGTCFKCGGKENREFECYLGSASKKVENSTRETCLKEDHQV